ncbi:MAG: iron ABC transporter permease, partial [Desulfovibrio sp.]|nr:iron ABC transporter permease [Desulfovibrio sp.]
MVSRVVAAAFICLLWALSPILSVFSGPVPIGFADALNFSSASSEPADMIIKLRLARAFAALACGGGLGAAGAVLQGVLRNPLADPFTMGIAQGAACGASAAIAAGASLSALSGLPHAPLIAALSFAGAILALLLALTLGGGRDPFPRENIILAGVAVATFMSALVALIKALNEESVASIVFWLMGSLRDRGWNSLPFLLCCETPCLALIALNWRKLDILSLGGDQAARLG